jgi:hypothetical protein
MMNNFNAYGGMNVWAPVWIGVFGPLLIVFVLWTIFWKGLALWHSAKKGQPWWFVAFLFINTAGILEIVYLFLILKLKVKDLFNKNK